MFFYLYNYTYEDFMDRPKSLQTGPILHALAAWKRFSLVIAAPRSALAATAT